MDLIKNKIRDVSKSLGYKYRIVNASRIPEIREAVGGLIREGLVDGRLSRNWRFYRENESDMPGVKSIIVTALPHPITRFTFKYGQKIYSADVPPTYLASQDELNIQASLAEIIKYTGYKTSKARVPLKTLAVRSGLAEYGKNNIAYVPGMGSFCRLTAFYTDAPLEADHWQASGFMNNCQKCTLCRDNCPTGSITDNRLLIHAENCLTRFNEEESPLPEGIKPDRHNALVGCMYCQSLCPVNKPYLKNIVQGPAFSEEETRLILSKTPVEKLPGEVRQKLDNLITEEIYPVMARNLTLLIEKQRHES